MLNPGLTKFQTMRNAALLGLALALALGTSGCRSAQDKANDAAIAQAKLTAAQTNTAQQVVWTDADGTTTTTVIQPPLQGQTAQQVTTTKSTAKVSGGTTTQQTTVTHSTTPVTTPVNAPLQAPAMVPLAPAASAPDTLAPAPVAPAQNGVVQPVITPVDVHVARGTTLAIRVNRTISVKTSKAGERFSGEVAHGVVVNGREVIPRGTAVEGVIDASHRRGHFKGRSVLELRLVSMTLNGTRYRLDTHDNVRTKKGKGKRSTAIIGGGTGLGMLIGGVATGGVGLVVGGLAGAGGGTLLGGLTGNRDLVIPAESVVNFRLADDLVVQPE